MKNLLSKLKKTRINPKIYLDFPESPGIYLFFKNSEPIYVGKAINLKRRVASYFRIKLEAKTLRMVSEATEMSYIKVDSELEALLLEARLIRFYMPKYNIAAKDDKHPLYIQITKDEFPRITTLRKVDVNNYPSIATYGPFPSSTNVKSVLKMIRRIFPYSDHKIGKRGCIYSQIALCKPCPNEVSKTTDNVVREEKTREYIKNIKYIKSLLDGKISELKKNLEKEMTVFSKLQKYEEALSIRNKIKRLEYITTPKNSIEAYLENPNLYEDVRDRELIDLKQILKTWNLKTNSLKRIECYDVAHLQGANATASMVTFSNGTPDKDFYRHFRIRQSKGWDDYASLREVSKRRINHLSDWGVPDLVIVDGGKGQVAVLVNEFRRVNVPVVGLAKRFETLVIPSNKYETTEIKEYKLPKGPALNLVQRIRDEAHRFARAYHHKLLARSLFETNNKGSYTKRVHD